MTIVAAVAAAAAGELEGLRPFVITYSAARLAAREEREARALNDTPDIALLPLHEGVTREAARLLIITHKAINRIERMGRNAPLDEALRAAKLLTELHKLNTARPHKGTPASTDSRERTKSAEPAAPSFLQGLAKNLPTPDPHPTNTPTPYTDRGSEHPPPATTPTRQPHQQTSTTNPVSSHAIASAGVERAGA